MGFSRGEDELELGARHAHVIHEALKHWVQSSALSQRQADQLADTIVVRGFDWEKLAKYTFRLAVLCLAAAAISFIMEGWFVRFCKRVMAMPPWLRGTITALAALAVHVLAYQRSRQLPEQKYANEAIHAVGALAFALAALQVLEQLHKSFDRAGRTADDGGQGEKGSDEDKEAKRRMYSERERLAAKVTLSVALGLATVYAAVGLLAQTNFIWSLAMLVVAYCCGGYAGYWHGMYWIDTESPLAFTVTFVLCLT